MSDSTDKSRPKPHPAAPNKPAVSQPSKRVDLDPYWGTEFEGYSLAHAESVALFVGAVEAINNGDAEGFRALCESAAPRDYANAAHLFLDFLNNCVRFGVNPQGTLASMRSQVNAYLAKQA